MYNFVLYYVQRKGHHILCITLDDITYIVYVYIYIYIFPTSTILQQLKMCIMHPLLPEKSKKRLKFSTYCFQIFSQIQRNLSLLLAGSENRLKLSTHRFQIF